MHLADLLLFLHHEDRVHVRSALLKKVRADLFTDVCMAYALQ